MSSTARGATRRRAVWNITDQVVSSASNAVVTILVARTATPEEFGWFAVAFTTSLLLLSMVRQVVHQPFLLGASALSGDAFRVEARSAAGATCLVGAAAGSVLLAVAVALGGSAGTGLAMAGLTLPLLFLQDLLRFVGLAGGRPQDAALSDSVWFAALLVVMGSLISARVVDGWAYVLAWGATAGLAAAVAAGRSGWLPRARGSLRWVWERRSTSGWLLLEFMSAYGSVQIVVLLVGAVAGADQTGAWRGTQTLLGPVNVLGMAASAFLVPELLRRPHLTSRHYLTAAGLLSGGLALVNLVYGGVLLAVPDAVGEQVLGQTWDQSEAFLLPLTIWSAAVALSLGPLFVLMSMGRTRSAAVVSVSLAPVLLTFAAVGLVLDEGLGAAYGVMIAQSLVVPLWWHVLRRALRAAPGSSAPDALDVPQSVDSPPQAAR